MGLSDPFNNASPAAITPPLGTAFSNTAAGVHDIPLSGVFSNIKPETFYTGEERYLAVCAPSGNQNLNQLIAGATVAGVTLADGNIVLVTGSNQAEHNGIFLVNGAGAAAIRAHPMTTPFSVRVGPSSTVNANKVFAYYPAPNFVLETTHVNFIETTATAHPL